MATFLRTCLAQARYIHGTKATYLCQRFTRSMQTSALPLQISDEVIEAVKSNRPVVALETALYTHGFPYPDNIALAAQLESIVRSNGGVPATIGILKGRAIVGMDKNELHALVEEPNPIKISRRDIGFAIGLRSTTQAISGGTTIAGTMILAHLAGIKVFATGGLGGVHRGGENSLDVSADLTEMGRTPVAVISSGCKSFLDIGRTLEALETQGVGVATFADGRDPQKVEFPGFWSRDSGFMSPKVIESTTDAARILCKCAKYLHSVNSAADFQDGQLKLGLSSGVLFANPVPEEASIPYQELLSYIEEAVALAEQAGARGSANTPFVLSTLTRLTNGRNVVANRACLESNVARGTEVAVALSLLEGETRGFEPDLVPKHLIAPQVCGQASSLGPNKAVQPLSRVDVLAVGAIAIDTTCDYRPLRSSEAVSPTLKTSNPVKIYQSLGGVAHNVARAAQLLGCSVKLCSTVVDDSVGRIALSLLSDENLDSAAILKVPARKGVTTAQYVSINDTQGEMIIAGADMSIFEDGIDELEEISPKHVLSTKPKCVVIDANLSKNQLRRWTGASKASGATVAFEPVSVEKSTKLFELKDKPLPVYPAHEIDFATPNSLELLMMHQMARETAHFERRDWWHVINALGIPSSGIHAQLTALTSSALVERGIPQCCIQLLPFIPCIMTKLGAEGVLMARLIPEDDEYLNSATSAPYMISRSGGTYGIGGLYLRYFPAPEIVHNPISVNGAGDTFLGFLAAALSHVPLSRVAELVDAAQQASIKSLQSKSAVHPNLGSLKSLITSRV